MDTLARRALYVLLALVIVRFWIMPLGASFSDDEAGTFWTVKDGLATMLTRVAMWPNTPPAYGFVFWAALRIGGAHEFLLRLPSLLSMVVAAALTWRLARRLFGAEAALPAAAVLLALGPVVVSATDARPYALLLALAAASTLSLVAWLDTGALVYAVAYLITAGLIPYVHILASPLLLAHAVYAFFRFRERTPVRFTHLAAVFVLTALLTVPAALMFVGISHKTQMLNFITFPYPAIVAEQMAPPVFLVAAGIGLVAAWLICMAVARGPLVAARSSAAQSSLLLAVAVILIPNCLLIAVSVAGPVSVYLERYLMVTNIGIALLAGWAMGRLQPALARYIVIAGILLYSVLTYGQLGHRWPLHAKENWRAALATVRETAGPGGTPVLIQSPYIEARSLLPAQAADPPGFLFAPVVMYPIGAPFTPLSDLNTDAESKWINQTVMPRLLSANRFIIVELTTQYRDWFAERLPEWQAREMGNFGPGLHAVLFERRAGTAAPFATVQ